VRQILALLIAAIGLSPLCSQAADYPRGIAQHTHQRWSAESKAPGPIFTIAQGKDGYLWLGALQGLYRFDGVSFEKIEPEPAAPPQGAPTALVVTRNGDVWVNFALTGNFAVYRKGALRLMPRPEGRGDHQIISLVETPDGAIWAAPGSRERGLYRFKDGRWRHVWTEAGLPDAYTNDLDLMKDGTLWLDTDEDYFLLKAGASRFVKLGLRVQGDTQVSQGPQGRIWLSEANGTYPLTGPDGRALAPEVRHRYPTADPSIGFRSTFDRAGNLWAATQFNGLQRVIQPKPAGAGSSGEAAASVEAFRAADGLTTDITMNPFEDREGNIWVTTEKGLDKFRPSSLRVEPLLTDPPRFGDVLLGASDGSVYVAEASTVYRVLPGGAPKPILTNTRAPEAMCEAPDGAVWITFVDRTVIWKDGRALPVAKRPVLTASEQFHSCAFDRSGDYWATAFAGGMYRYRAERWEPMFGRTNKATFYPGAMVRDTRGRLVVRWSEHTLSWLDYPQRSSAFLGDSLEDELTRATLYVSANGDVFTAGKFGFKRFRNERPRTLSEAQAKPYFRVEGIVETPDGETWTVHQPGVVRTRTADLARAFDDPTFIPPTLELTSDDGLPDRVYGRGGRSIVRGGDGRLWIATLAGTVWLDPKKIIRNPTPPNVVIASLKVGEALHRDPGALTLPAAPATVEINYAVLSFANPQGVAIRYRLEGYDADWIDPGSRRQAFYTNLPPGKYRFRVIAANNEGVWNRKGAAVDFRIPPTFLQSGWFLALCIAIGALLLGLLYRLRVAQISQRVRVGLEARLAERERIARELHDTLLQSVQGLILRFQSVANRIPATDPSRAQLESALKRADEVVIDGRNRVRDLRTSEGTGNLQAVLQEMVRAADVPAQIPVRFVAEGAPRDLHPAVAAEVALIAQEALFNTVRHAGASSAEIVLAFTPQQLSVTLRDDGVGIAPDVLADGRKHGHYGLVGMRERAERIGATVEIDSPSGGGTLVTLTLPAALAFADRPRDWRRILSVFQPRKGSAVV
jgi:signal transduction histidine kinase/sugar lactone lactonase YvrE